MLNYNGYYLLSTSCMPGPHFKYMHQFLYAQENPVS